MLAPLPDLPMGYAQSGRAHYPTVISTPPPKNSIYGGPNGLHPDRFGLIPMDVFSHHALEERIRSEVFYEAIELSKKAEAVLASFDHSDSKEFLEGTGILFTFLIFNRVNKVTFERTTDGSLLAHGKANGLDVMMEIFFDSDESRGYEVFLNVYDGPRQVLTLTGAIEKILVRYRETIDSLTYSAQ
ncbi:MAG: hypothetical protein LH606_18215 [Cytophagaceae bacterium]|nr:hypothetical protein [Cytophagaceae bacterium]